MAILSSDQVKMTSILEKIVAIIAPHRCIICGNYNNILCLACLHAVPRLEVACCVLCGKPTPDWRLCASCGSITSLQYIWPFAAYDGAIASAIHVLKFDHARAAAGPLAQCMDMAIPYIATDWIIVPIPTAPVRVRQRGYDQALLLAQELAARRQLSCLTLLTRQHNTRQVGATRRVRQAQVNHLFAAKSVVGKKILLVDDVCTTGATLQAAAHALNQAGATEIAAAVVAWKV